MTPAHTNFNFLSPICEKHIYWPVLIY